MKYKQLTTDELIAYVIDLKWSRSIKKIHIHHTWSPNHTTFSKNGADKTQQGMYNYHVNTLKWADIGQNLTLFPDGTWGTGRDFNTTPVSISGHNTDGFAIEMVGNFDIGNDVFGGKQELSAMKFLYFFISHMKLGISDVLFHREFSTKTCPGTSIDKSQFVKNITLKEDNMNERINLKFVSDGEIIKDLEKKTVDLLSSRLDSCNPYVEETVPVLYEYCGYIIVRSSRQDANAMLLQKALNDLGASPKLTEDGFPGGATIDALYRETKSNVVTKETAELINEKLNALETNIPPIDGLPVGYKPYIELDGKVIKNYSRFGMVRQGQTMLDGVGHELEIDGHFGKGSDAATRSFQKLNGLEVTGIIDEATWNILSYKYEKFQDTQDVRIDWYDNQTKILRVKKNEVYMKMVKGNGAVETVSSMMKRTEGEVVLASNSGLFGMKNGVTLSLLIADGKVETMGVYSRWAICQTTDGDIKMLGLNWELQVHGNLDHIEQAAGGCPSLIVGGKRNVDLTGIQNEPNYIHENHPRLCYGLDEEYLIFIIAHGRDVSNGFYGNDVDGMVEIGLDIEAKELLMEDGGFSINVRNGNDEPLDNSPGNRKVDHAIVLIKK